MSDLIRSVTHLEDRLSQPPAEVVRMMHRVRGDVLVLGADGTMGPSLARMARRAADRSPFARRVIAVAHFSDQQARQRLEEAGVETIAGDLLDPRFLEQLPDAENVVCMPAVTATTPEHAPQTWAINGYLSGSVCRRFHYARLAVVSTARVYGPTQVGDGGSRETDPLRPEDEDAASCLGRERIFEYFSREQHTPVAIVRLSDACELRYGVLLDLAKQVQADAAVNLRRAWFTAIWQGDANAMTLQALEHASVPPFVINVAGSEILTAQSVAQQFGQLMGRTLHFIGEQSPRAFIASPARATRLFGLPSVSVWQMMRWIAQWLNQPHDSHAEQTPTQMRNGI